VRWCWVDDDAAVFVWSFRSGSGEVVLLQFSVVMVMVGTG
jgi:hypothetical protein